MLYEVLIIFRLHEVLIYHLVFTPTFHVVDDLILVVNRKLSHRQKGTSANELLVVVHIHVEDQLSIIVKMFVDSSKTATLSLPKFFLLSINRLFLNTFDFLVVIFLLK